MLSPRTVLTALGGLVACFALLWSAAVQATDAPVQGGPGGSDFRSDCSGDYVVGIYVKSGAWVDAIGLKCGTFDATSGRFKQPPWSKPYYGGTGGAGQQEGICPPDRYVSGIRFGFTRDGDRPKYLDFVELTCTPISFNNTSEPNKVCVQTGDGCWSFTHTTHFPPLPGEGLGVFIIAAEQSCSGLEAATGIHGRSGIYVDALGLICGPKPAALQRGTSVGTSVVVGRNPALDPFKTKPPPGDFQVNERRHELTRWKAMGSKWATVLKDVDIYAGPGGNFENTHQFMRKGDRARVLGHHPDGWTRLILTCGKPECWVADDHIKISP